ncbi:hypothetical protein K466DRAFT_596440 [Polyporus arcularius HHB13444]|uniref:Uncharacterized protein n=1 Tax=Polyporus arcularius HHB13444 TaxID=1314778 RepID=A0A5C3PPS6_9APHY|nr:hypothetical protein K466DRAFT_596440 [Polyporus arcularius HHB13444]
MFSYSALTILSALAFSAFTSGFPLNTPVGDAMASIGIASRDVPPVYVQAIRTNVEEVDISAPAPAHVLRTDDAQEPPTAGAELQDTYTRALAALRSLLDQAEKGSIGPISAEDRAAILNGVELMLKTDADSFVNGIAPAFNTLLADNRRT